MYSAGFDILTRLFRIKPAIHLTQMYDPYMIRRHEFCLWPFSVSTISLPRLGKTIPKPGQ